MKKMQSIFFTLLLFVFLAPNAFGQKNTSPPPPPPNPLGLSGSSANGGSDDFCVFMGCVSSSKKEYTSRGFKNERTFPIVVSFELSIPSSLTLERIEYIKYVPNQLGGWTTSQHEYVGGIYLPQGAILSLKYFFTEPFSQVFAIKEDYKCEGMNYGPVFDMMESYSWYNPIFTGYVWSGGYYLRLKKCGHQPSPTDLGDLVIDGGISGSLPRLVVDNDYQLLGNPTRDFIGIRKNHYTSGSISFSVFSIEGKKMKQNVIQYNEGIMNESIDISNLNQGVYFIIIKDQEGQIIFTEKIIKL